MSSHWTLPCASPLPLPHRLHLRDRFSVNWTPPPQHTPQAHPLLLNLLCEASSFLEAFFHCINLSTSLIMLKISERIFLVSAHREGCYVQLPPTWPPTNSYLYSWHHSNFGKYLGFLVYGLGLSHHLSISLKIKPCMVPMDSSHSIT